MVQFIKRNERFKKFTIQEERKETGLIRIKYGK